MLLQWILSKQNLLRTSFCGQNWQVKLTKTSYNGTLFEVWFIQDSVLFRIQLIQDSVLFRIQFIQDTVLFRVQFRQFHCSLSMISIFPLWSIYVINTHYIVWWYKTLYQVESVVWTSITTSCDAVSSCNRQDLIHSLVPPHYVCNKLI
jgi:hypothetical protein